MLIQMTLEGPLNRALRSPVRTHDEQVAQRAALASARAAEAISYLDSVLHLRQSRQVHTRTNADPDKYSGPLRYSAAVGRVISVR